VTDGPELFPGFHSRVIETPGARIRVRIGGTGPLVVLLHGYPQTGAMWHRIAARLAARHTVAVPDLRGYGASECFDEDFSFRAMAADVAALLDILPTTEVWRLMSPEMIRAYYHWGFLARPEVAEPMIAHDPVRFLHSALAGLYSPLEAFHPQALAEYEQAICRPRVIHAICGDYQAGATVDLAHDEADLHRRPDLPALVLWGARGKVGAEVDPLEVWRARLPRAEGRAIDAGHYLVEEAPEETWAAIAGFLERI